MPTWSPWSRGRVARQRHVHRTRRNRPPQPGAAGFSAASAPCKPGFVALPRRPVQFRACLADKDRWRMHHRFKKLAGTLAAVALAAGLTMTGTGTARADVVPPASTWAEIFAPEINASGITLCADNSGSSAQFQNLQLWRCHGYASNGTPQRWQFEYANLVLAGPVYRIANVGSGL